MTDIQKTCDGHTCLKKVTLNDVLWMVIYMCACDPNINMQGDQISLNMNCPRLPATVGGLMTHTTLSLE